MRRGDRKDDKREELGDSAPAQRSAARQGRGRSGIELAHVGLVLERGLQAARGDDADDHDERGEDAAHADRHEVGLDRLRTESSNETPRDAHTDIHTHTHTHRIEACIRHP